MADYSLLLWTLNNIRSIDGDPFSFENYRFLIPIYLADPKEGVIQKAAQIGATVFAIAWFLFHVKKGRNGMYYLPTDDFMATFVATRINRLVDQNPGVGALIQQTDSVRTKAIGKGYGFFFGLTGKMQKHSTPASLQVYDELDKAPGPKDVEEAEERTGAAKDPMKLYLSVPSFPGFGVNRRFLATNQQAYHMKCNHCGKWNFSPTVFDPEHKQTVEEDELRYPDCIQDGFLACRHCGKELKGYRIAEWVAKRPAQLIPGWHITRLMSPLFNAEKTLKKYREATNVQNFVNSDLGLPYADGESYLSKDHILSLCQDYSNYVSLDKRYVCTAGIDVGKALHVVISRPSTIPGFVREAVFVGECHGAAGEKFNELDRLLRRFNVRKFVIDGLPETSEVERFLSKWRGKGYACFYADQKLKNTWTNPGTRVIKNNLPVIQQIGTVTVNRTESLDISHAVLRDKKECFPRRGIVMEDFSDHCLAIARMERTDKHGSIIYEWVQDESQKDHYRHAHNYDVMCWDTTAQVSPGGRLVMSPKGVDKAGRQL